MGSEGSPLGLPQSCNLVLNKIVGIVHTGLDERTDADQAHIVQAAGQSVKLAMVRFTISPSSRSDPRSRTAGGELRLGTESTYIT
jgi:hypothetical protein